MNRRVAFAALVALFVVAAGLIALELANGAANAGALAVLLGVRVGDGGRRALRRRRRAVATTSAPVGP